MLGGDQKMFMCEGNAEVNSDHAQNNQHRSMRENKRSSWSTLLLPSTTLPIIPIFDTAVQVFLWVFYPTFGDRKISFWVENFASEL